MPSIGTQTDPVVEPADGAGEPQGMTAEQRKEIAKTALKYTGYAVGGLLVGFVAAPAALAAAGFGAGGVVAGSAAAAAQSAIYGGATSGVFSMMTSAGAAGMAATTQVGIAAGAAAAARGAEELVVTIRDNSTRDMSTQT